MSKREGSMKRKFSFEIPKLKIGPKNDNKTSSHPSRTDQDSPPATPKSVRPPLSPKTDHQLRLACAYVLQDFKPSHQLYEERYGRTEEEKPRLSYPVAEKWQERDGESADAPLVRKLSNRMRSDRRKDAQEASGSERPKMKPTIKSQAFFEGLHIDSKTLDGPPLPDKLKISQMVDEEIRIDLSNFNPPIASPAFFGGVDIDRLRKEHFPGSQPPPPAEEAPISPEIAEPKLAMPLKRSVSNPISPRIVSGEQRGRGRRSESADTTASSPRTDGTENPWNISTAPTSTAVTPARGSMRRSSQPVGSEKFLTADIEWMRQELERHKRAQDEAKAHQELQNQVLVSLGMEPRSSVGKDWSSQIPLRKPLPSNDNQASNSTEAFTRGRSTSQSIQERRNVPPVPQLDSLQSQRLAQSESRRQRTTPRSESAHELDMIRPESKQARRSRRASADSEPPSRSISREIKDFFRNNSSEALVGESADVSRASSRSRRLFQVNVRPNDGTRAPQASVESSKPQSRSRSIDSIRSAVSAVAPSIDSAASKMRSWKSFAKSHDSSSTGDGSRSGTSLSSRHSRDLNHDSQQSSESRKKGKSAINLNRELPPLPSLDQWKAAEPEKPKHIASMASPKRGSIRLSESGIASELSLVGNESPVSPLTDTATASTSRIQSIYSRYSKFSDSWRPEQAPPYSAVASPGLPVEIVQPAIDQEFDFTNVVDSTLLPPSPPYLAVEEKQQQRIPSEYMFRKNLGAVTIPASPPPVPVEVEPQPKAIKRRTEDMFLPDLDAKARSSGQEEPVSDKQGAASKGHIVNYSRSAKRKNTVPMSNDSPISSHTKSPSEQINFSRKPSTDDYSRLYDMGYRNIVQIKPSSPADELKPLQAPQRKDSKRWWKRGTSKREKPSSLPALISADESAPTVVRF